MANLTQNQIKTEALNIINDIFSKLKYNKNRDDCKKALRNYLYYVMYNGENKGLLGDSFNNFITGA